MDWQIEREQVHTDCASPANLEVAEPRKRRGAGGDVRGDFTDHHHTGRVGRDEFGGHGAGGGWCKLLWNVSRDANWLSFGAMDEWKRSTAGRESP